MNHNLEFINKSLDWLYLQMQTNNLNKGDLQQITLATYNQQGVVEFDTFHEGDHAEGPQNFKPGNEN